MSRLVERYPHARRLPSSDIDTPADDAALLRLLQPYLGWVLAEIDTGSLDILICDYDATLGRPRHLLLLTGRETVVWLRNASSVRPPSNPGHTPVG